MAPPVRGGPVLALRESADGYRQRDPQNTRLYRLVAEHLETFLDHVREHHDCPLPAYVEQELRAYLKCGIHAHGFGRARCRECGRELLVAFSCQKRSVCPSCNARRMTGTAAHLIDHVFPDVPVRQWVLSVPFELRLTLARAPAALSAVGRIFVQEIFRQQRETAELRGLSPQHVRGGAVQFPQRFGGSLNLNVHYHVAVVDGVFVLEPDADGQISFHSLPRPSTEDLATITHNVSVRVTRWLGRRGLLRDPDRDDFTNEQPERDAVDACLQGSLGLGELTTLDRYGMVGGDDADPGSDPNELALPRPTKSARRGGHARGFDVHAGVTVAANDRPGRERLLRYCARPSLSLQRLSVLPDGRVVYALRKPWGRQTHRVMEPMQFMARLAALVPPPRHPLIRFHGVFAPHSAWRSRVVPCPDTTTRSRDELAKGVYCQPHAHHYQSRRPALLRPCGGPPTPACCAGSDVRAKCWLPPPLATPSVVPTSATPPSVSARPKHSAAAALCASGGAAHLSSAPAQQRANRAHRRRPPSARVDWAELLKRTYNVDALACPCGGRLRFISVITDRDVAHDILESVGLPSAPPPRARARSPDLVDPIPDDW